MANRQRYSADQPQGTEYTGRVLSPPAARAGITLNDPMNRVDSPINLAGNNVPLALGGYITYVSLGQGLKLGRSSKNCRVPVTMYGLQFN